MKSKKLKKTKQPQMIMPMLATLVDKPFDSKNFIYEHKWDGIRILAFKKDDKVNLITRNQLMANKSYPEIVQALERLPSNFILDGEIIASNNNTGDFSLLQQRMHRESYHNNKIKILYCIFDILYFDSYDVTNLALIERKKILEENFKFKAPLKLTNYIENDGIKAFEKACQLGWDGIIAKNINSIYQQKRSRDWLKIKCSESQELVIGGFTKPEGYRSNFGALLLGYYENDDLIYAGKVGTGFSNETLELVGKKLNKLKTNKMPFKSIDIPIRNITWVKPQLVAEIEFSQWTPYGKLRAPRFKGLRSDKNPKEIIREIPKKV